jgi:hypothetical protein
MSNTTYAILAVPFQISIETFPNDYSEVEVQRLSRTGFILTTSFNLGVN